MNWGLFEIPAGPHSQGCDFDVTDVARQVKELKTIVYPIVAELTRIHNSGDESDESIDREAHLVLQGIESLEASEFFKLYVPQASQWTVGPGEILTAEGLQQRLDEFQPVMTRIAKAEAFNGCSSCQEARASVILAAPLAVSALTYFVDIQPAARAAVRWLAPILQQLDIWTWNAQAASRAAVHALFPEPEGVPY